MLVKIIIHICQDISISFLYKFADNLINVSNVELLPVLHYLLLYYDTVESFMTLYLSYRKSCRLHLNYSKRFIKYIYIVFLYF